MAVKEIETRVAVAGGGPAGLMLGYLLARSGVPVVVVEKHADFLRDFRGDTIHPSTIEVMHELGLGEKLLALPHQKVERLSAQFGMQVLQLADFSHLPVRSKFIAMMPQWDFLNFLAAEGAHHPRFRLMMETEATGLVEREGKVVGITTENAEGRIRIHAGLVVGADGRNSRLRAASGLEVEDLGAPMDVLWFRLSRRETDTAETQGRFAAGRIFVMLNRGTYWQCAYVIPKGALERVRAEGLDAFRRSFGALLPFEAGRAEEIQSWDDPKLLTVKVDRLRQWWRPGLLFIGDAAHAMSPVGGVGINLAIQDAVAAANILASPLRDGDAGPEHLAAVERRRSFPTRMTQRLQVLVQNRVISRALEETGELTPPAALRFLLALPWTSRLPARFVGLGVRPEHVSKTIRNSRA